jgi:3-phenylpropionate/trans-cinnamate dioxygenase ferredoxin subunit
MSRHVVAAAAEIPAGGRKLITVKGREIGIFNVGGEFYALANRCPHAGGPMCEGRVGALISSSGPGNYQLERQGEFLRCPWHGWAFDIRTGQSWCDPNDMKIRQFKVAVEAGEALAKGPYVAETFPVTVEQQYIVIDI